MLDLVGNPNCWFSHAQAHVFCFAKYTHTQQSLIALVGAQSNFHVSYPFLVIKPLLCIMTNPLDMLYSMDLIHLKCTYTCIYKLKYS